MQRVKPTVLTVSSIATVVSYFSRNRFAVFFRSMFNGKECPYDCYHTGKNVLVVALVTISRIILAFPLYDYGPPWARGGGRGGG